MTCWHCHWGLPRAVREIYAAAMAKLDALYDGEGGRDLVEPQNVMHYGPGHIVWEDHNLGDGHIRWCIEECDKPEALGGYYKKTPEQIAILRESLVKLLAVPEEVRCWEPENYDGENPEDYPPPPNLGFGP